MRNAKELKTLIDSGEIMVAELSREELNALIEDILDNYDAENIFETELLDKCYEALEMAEVISSERYNRITSDVVESYNKIYVMPPRKKRIIVLIAAAIILFATLGGCRVLDFSTEGLGKELFISIPEQQKVSHGNVDLIWTNDVRSYDSAENLLKKENITDVVCFKKTPKGFTLKSAEYVELGENDRIEFWYECEGTQIYLGLERNRTPNLPVESFDEVYSAYGIDFCCRFNSTDGQTYAYWNYGEDTYILKVKAVNEELLKKAMYALEIYSAEAE